MTTTHQHSASADEAGELLNELAETMHGLAFPSDWAEEELGAVAKRLGVQSDALVAQSYVALDVRENGDQRATLRRMPFETHWRLAQMSDLLRLTRELVHGELDACTAKTELARVRRQGNPYPRALILACYGVYSLAVAARIGGGWRELAAAAVIGLAAGVIHFGTSRYRRVDLQKSFIAGAAGTLTALLLTLLWPSLDLGRALFGGITLLVPAMAITIATQELANEALESGVVRLAYGLLSFLMLAAGVGVVVRVWEIWATVKPGGPANPLPVPLVLAFIALGGLALVVCLGARWRHAPWIIGAALLAFGTQELTRVFFGHSGSPFLSALVLGVAAIAVMRYTSIAPATVLIPGLLQLAPGFLGTESMLSLIIGGSSRAQSDHFVSVVLVAVQLVIGLFLAPVLMRVGSPIGARDRTTH